MEAVAEFESPRSVRIHMGEPPATDGTFRLAYADVPTFVRMRLLRDSGEGLSLVVGYGSATTEEARRVRLQHGSAGLGVHSNRLMWLAVAPIDMDDLTTVAAREEARTRIGAMIAQLCERTEKAGSKLNYEAVEFGLKAFFGRSEEEKAVLRARFRERVRALQDPPWCRSCGRCVLAGRCCDSPKFVDE